MPDLSDFFNMFVDALRGAEKADPTFRVRFNNGPEYKRAKNCSSRTDLMLGTASVRNGVLVQALESFLRLDKQDPLWEPSYDRYMDFIVFKGKWSDGGRIALVTVEVENNLDEFRGTLSDLVRYQAYQKLGVFYDTEVASLGRRNKIEGYVHDVFNSFQRQGFVEAEKTEYMIVFGPVQLAEGAGIGDWSAIRFTTGSLRSLRDCWLSVAPQGRAARP